MNHAWHLTDLSEVLPPGHCSRESRRRRWHLVPYTTDTVSGCLALANPDTDAPDIRVPLPLRGSYNLYIGMQENFCDRLHLKLAGDRVFLRLAPWCEVGELPSLQKVFWRRLDLRGDEVLILRQEPGTRASITGIFAEPAEPAPEHPHDYIVQVTDDGFPSNWGRPADDEDATWTADAFPLLEVDRLLYGTNVLGMARYPTRHPELRLDLEACTQETSPRPTYGLAMELMLDQNRRGFNVPAQIAERLAAGGIHFTAYARMGHGRCPPPYSALRSPFFDAHPELRCEDADGTPVNRLSLAWPEVRRIFNHLFEECLEWGAAGITNVFVRGLPLILWEEPVRQALGLAAGERLPEDDPELLRVRADFVTRFMREQRAMTQRHGGATVTAVVPATPALCTAFALDVESWIQEGLIDVLCPYRWGERAADVPLDMDGYAALTQGSGVQLMPFVNTWRDKTAMPILREALRLTAWPIDGLSIWDGLSRPPDVHHAIRALHSRPAMEAAIDALANGPQREIIRTLEGLRNDDYSFGWLL